MAKKEKKVYKPKLTLAPKVSLNHKWTSWRQSEAKNRQAHALHSLKKLTLQSLWFDHQTKPNRLELNSNNVIQYQIWNMDKRASTPKLRNYCHYIGRSRGITRKLFMARHTFRKFARFGMLPGFTKERC